MIKWDHSQEFKYATCLKKEGLKCLDLAVLLIRILFSHIEITNQKCN